jgi:hypothetical protein
MSIEDRPERQPQDGPPTRDEWEMSFIGNMTGAVDTLFTYKPIVEKLQGLEGDEQVQNFVQQWKQVVNLYLEETAWTAVESFLADFERLQAGETPLLSPTPPQTNQA